MAEGHVHDVPLPQRRNANETRTVFGFLCQQLQKKHTCNFVLRQPAKQWQYNFFSPPRLQCTCKSLHMANTYICIYISIERAKKNAVDTTAICGENNWKNICTYVCGGGNNETAFLPFLIIVTVVAVAVVLLLFLFFVVLPLVAGRPFKLWQWLNRSHKK